MLNSLYHAADGGGILLYYGVVHLLESESIECTLLHCRAIDAAFDLLDCYL